MTKEKEPRFFDDDTYYTRGLDRYLRDHFRGAAGFKARGEATPAYLAIGTKGAGPHSGRLGQGPAIRGDPARSGQAGVVTLLASMPSRR